MISSLQDSDPALWEAFRKALRKAEGESQLLRGSGRYPLTGRGDINTYSVFAEAMRSLLGPSGRAGVIVPTGIATDDTTKHFFGSLVTRRSLASLYSFENEDRIFAGVHNEFKFCLLTMTGPQRPVTAADFVFFARQALSLADPERHFSLTPEDFELINPNTRTCPTFRSRRDAEIAKTVFRKVPVLIRDDDPEGNPWGLSFLRMFDMANDSGLFHDASGSDRLPLWEGKMIYQFDHRFGTYDGQTQAQRNKGMLPQTSGAEKRDPSFQVAPTWWVPEPDVRDRTKDRSLDDWFLVWRSISSPALSRTVVSAAIPRAAVSGKLPIAVSSQPAFPLLLANLNSFVLDWSARQKIGGTDLGFFYVKQFPVLPPTAYDQSVHWNPGRLGEWLRPYVVELAYTSWDLASFARDLGWDGPPFIWSDDRRSFLRAEVDAGRSFPMSVCYRSTDEIMQAVGALGQYVSTEEFGQDGVRGLATATVRSGSRPRLATFERPAEEIEWLMSQLDVDDPELDATGILVFTNNAARDWRARLRDLGIGSVPLEEYRGRSMPGVKVGTYHRAKGLEFKRLFLPGLDDRFPRGDRNDPDELIEAGSLLYVAMSRAKDDLTLSYAGRPSMFIEALRPFVDQLEEATTA